MFLAEFKEGFYMEFSVFDPPVVDFLSAGMHGTGVSHE